MAEQSGQDKSEEPTAKRLTDARKKGQVPRSRELETFVILVASACLFAFVGGWVVTGLKEILEQQLQLSRDVLFDPESPKRLLAQAFGKALGIIFPLQLVLTVFALLTPLLMGGWNFSTQAFQPKFSKLNPLTGVKKIIGVQGLIELVKAIIKILLVFTVAGILFRVHWRELMTMNTQPLLQGLERTAEILIQSFLLICASLVVVVVVDVPFQLWNNKRQLKMTKQEVKDESKEAEGSPEVKGRIRRLQMDMAQRRMMNEVPKADVIVTNPTHFAVALKYDQSSSGAPIVIAKGVDMIAAQIRNLAVAADIPLVAVPPLARALYYSTDLNEEIPQGLFLAVAQVLAYVFQLKASNMNGWEKPTMPTNVVVPDEFRQS